MHRGGELRKLGLWVQLPPPPPKSEGTTPCSTTAVNFYTGRFLGAPKTFRGDWEMAIIIKGKACPKCKDTYRSRIRRSSWMRLYRAIGAKMYGLPSGWDIWCSTSNVTSSAVNGLSFMGGGKTSCVNVCTRQCQLQPKTVLDNGDGTVTDNVTGLMWQTPAGSVNPRYPAGGTVARFSG